MHNAHETGSLAAIVGSDHQKLAVVRSSYRAGKKKSFRSICMGFSAKVFKRPVAVIAGRLSKTVHESVDAGIEILLLRGLFLAARVAGTTWSKSEKRCSRPVWTFFMVGHYARAARISGTRAGKQGHGNLVGRDF